MKRIASITAAALLFSALVVQAATGSVAVSSSSRAQVKTAFNKKVGKKILVDGAGRTLYMFTTDVNGKDTVCIASGPYGATCPRVWPALTSSGKPRAGKGVKASLLGVYKRSDGKHQVTYNHHPLYYFHGGSGFASGDKKPGDAHGQGYANEWFVLSPKGNPIRK